MARILVVDDEIGMREGCRRALVRHGFQVDTAEHGVEGMRKLREEHFDLVLLDAMMPGMSGLEILDRICEQDPHIVCIMITGYATVDLAARAMKQGAHDFLPKPFTSDDLIAVVQRGLEERQRRIAFHQQKQREEESLLLERTRQERAKLDAIESRFMLVVVHELRNPAGVIKNYLQMIRGGYIEDDELDEYLEKVDLRAGQLLSMLDDLLELANLKGMLTFKTQATAVAPILEEVVRHFRPLAEKKGLEFQAEILARPTMMAQPGHLRSLWSNLIDNALRYTPRGRISIKLDQQQDQVLMIVSDTGIGISTEELTRIFQEFYRSDTAKEAVALGTGLGLPIVHQIVQIYQGSIEVDSIAGEGSTFAVRLPLASQPDPTE